jgi:hypothetical protein
MSLIAPLALCLRKIDVKPIGDFFGRLKQEILTKINIKLEEYRIQKLKNKKTQLTEKYIAQLRGKYDSFLISIDVLQNSIENQMNETDMELTYESIQNYIHRNVNWGPLIVAAYDFYDTEQSIQRKYNIDTIDPVNEPLIVKAVFDLVWHNEIEFYDDPDTPLTIDSVSQYINDQLKDSDCEKETKHFNVNPSHTSVTSIEDSSLIGARVMFYEMPDEQIYAELTDFMRSINNFNIKNPVHKKKFYKKKNKLLIKYGKSELGTAPVLVKGIVESIEKGALPFTMIKTSKSFVPRFVNVLGDDGNMYANIDENRLHLDPVFPYPTKTNPAKSIFNPHYIDPGTYSHPTYVPKPSKRGKMSQYPMSSAIMPLSARMPSPSARMSLSARMPPERIPSPPVIEIVPRGMSFSLFNESPSGLTKSPQMMMPVRPPVQPDTEPYKLFAKSLSKRSPTGFIEMSSSPTRRNKRERSKSNDSTRRIRNKDSKSSSRSRSPSSKRGGKKTRRATLAHA